jgi:ribonuclease P protein component
VLSVIPQQHVDPAAGGRYPKTARVLRTAEFRNIYDNGVRLSTPLFAAFCLSRPGAQPAAGARLGLTVPRAVGKAVQRNRIKRRLREAFRLHRARFGGSWDIVLNPRRAVLGATFAEIERALEKVIQRCLA